MSPVIEDGGMNRQIWTFRYAMLEVTLVGVGCNKSWKLEDKIIQLSRELGIPVQINKIMDLDSIIDMNLRTIPALLHGDSVWTYDEVMKGAKLKEILIDLSDHAPAEK